MALAENDIQLKKLTLKEYCRACHKFRDVVLFAVFSLVLALAFIIWVGSDASTREYFRGTVAMFDTVADATDVISGVPL